MNTNIIENIIKNTDLKQKSLAEKLSVSRAQIYKWKTGERIPFDREEELNKLAGLFGWNIDWAVFAKIEKNGRAWFEYLSFMGDCNNRQLDDTPEVYAVGLLFLLSKLGASIPKQAPLKKDILADEEYEYTNFDELILGLADNYCFRKSRFYFFRLKIW